MPEVALSSGSRRGPHIDGSTLARWIVHYANGSTREWPVIYGEHVRDWTWVPAEEPLGANQAKVVWRGPPPLSVRKDFDSVRLFETTWSNPQPEIEITSLEYRIGENRNETARGGDYGGIAGAVLTAKVP
jgi:hypothetical protein